MSKAPSVSVIIPTYSLERYDQLKEAINSLVGQSHSIDEIIIVVGGTHALKERIDQDFKEQQNLKVVFSENNLSATQARNLGIKSAKSDILAFTDDDIVADREWIAKLMVAYEQTDSLAIGGKVLPIWLSREPDYFPEELCWLIGVIHESFLSDRVREIRNTFGPNMSFKREVFEKIGYFNESLGFADRGTSYVQGEEPEFGLRMLHAFGKGIVYDPDVVIYHKVPQSKLKLNILLKRSFYQGYSKAFIQRLSYTTTTLKPERSYLKNVFFAFIPGRIKNIFTGYKPVSQIKKLLLLIVCVALVGIGFIYGYLKFLGYKRQ